MKHFTIGYITHSPQTHSRYLGYSLQHLQGEFEVIHTTDEKFPAHNYNDMLERCTTEFLILTHEDVSFAPDLLAAIQRSIDFVPDFGVLGMVGADAGGTHRWSTLAGIYPVDTLDCCFIVVRPAAPARFDTAGFGEFHLYVEDYCAQMLRTHGKQNHTIHTDSGEMPDPLYVDRFALTKLQHHSATVSQRGYCWGRYPEFRAALDAKWPGIKTT
jgi:hypothetical protein